MSKAKGWRSSRRAAFGLLLASAGVVTSPETLRGQRIELQLLGGEMSNELGGVGRGLTLAPSVLWVGSPGWLRVGARATTLEGGGRVLGADAAFRLVLARSGPFEVGSTASVGALAAGSGFRSLGGTIAPGLTLLGDWGSVGVKAGVRAASLGARGRAPGNEALPLPVGRPNETRVSAGLWAEGRTRVGALELSALGRGFRADGVSWQEAEGAAALRLGRLTLSGFVGGRTGAGSATWSGAGANLRLSPGIELTGRLARHPSDPLTGLPGGRTAAVGITLSGGILSAASAEAPARPVRLTVRAKPGARVELLGDWDDWRSRPVPHRGDGIYEIELHLRPGTHHFVFRVDGAPHVPEGYETAPDDFGGRSAVVRVRG